MEIRNRGDNRRRFFLGPPWKCLELGSRISRLWHSFESFAMTDMTEAMDLAKTLDELSAKATQGAGEVLAPDTEHDFGVPLVATNYPGTYGPTNGLILWATMLPSEIDAKDVTRAQANASFTAALWNLYRTGKLVVVPDDAVERMAIGISDGLATRLGRVREDWLNESTRADAAAALAALKGADHAG